MRFPRVLFNHSVVFPLFFATTLAFLGCNGGDDGSSNNGKKATSNGNSKADEPEFISMGTAPIGGAFNPVGISLSETLNEHKGDNNWQVQAKGTKGSQHNIRELQNSELQLALSNSAITHFAVEGGGTWDQTYDMCAIVTIAPNVAMFITKQDSGIEKIADLKGKRVVCGPSGAGFEMFLEPILKAHGLTFGDFDKKNNNQNGAVDMLADGQADAAFLGGAVPTSSIQRACSEQAIHFIPYEEEAVERLLAEYPFFQRVTIPADKYSDLTEDFPCLNVGSMHLITSADEPDDRIYQITKTLYANRATITHPAAKFINEKNAARFTGTPFHPGAQKFYEEIGIWPKSTDDADSSDKSKSDGSKGGASDSDEGAAKK